MNRDEIKRNIHKYFECRTFKNQIYSMKLEQCLEINCSIETILLGQRAEVSGFNLLS